MWRSFIFVCDLYHQFEILINCIEGMMRRKKQMKKKEEVRDSLHALIGNLGANQ